MGVCSSQGLKAFRVQVHALVHVPGQGAPGKLRVEILVLRDPHNAQGLTRPCAVVPEEAVHGWLQGKGKPTSCTCTHTALAPSPTLFAWHHQCQCCNCNLRYHRYPVYSIQYAVIVRKPFNKHVTSTSAAPTRSSLLQWRSSTWVASVLPSIVPENIKAGHSRVVIPGAAQAQLLSCVPPCCTLPLSRSLSLSLPLSPSLPLSLSPSLLSLPPSPSPSPSLSLSRVRAGANWPCCLCTKPHIICLTPPMSMLQLQLTVSPISSIQYTVCSNCQEAIQQTCNVHIGCANAVLLAAVAKQHLGRQRPAVYVPENIKAGHRRVVIPGAAQAQLLSCVPPCCTLPLSRSLSLSLPLSPSLPLSLSPSLPLSLSPSLPLSLPPSLSLSLSRVRAGANWPCCLCTKPENEIS